MSSALIISAFGILACDSGSRDKGVPAPRLPERLAITADWQAGTLSYVDLERLTGPAVKRGDVLDFEVDLTAYAPGPLLMEATPDGKTLLVAVSNGFVAIPGATLLVGDVQVEQAPGSLLFVDIATGKVETELATGDGPNGLAVTPDGARAFVTNFGSENMVVVDMDTREIIETVELGAWAEDVVLDDTGTVALTTYTQQGIIAAFKVADPGGSLQVVPDTGDTAGMAFFPGTKTAFAVVAPNLANLAPGYVAIDVSDPDMPTVVDRESTTELLIAGPVQAHAKRGSVLVPTTLKGRLELREYKLEGEEVVLVQAIDVAEGTLLEIFGFDHDGADLVVMADTRRRQVITTNLRTKQTTVADWEQTVGGPTDVVVSDGLRATRQ